MGASNATVAIDVSPQRPKRTASRCVPHGVYTPVVHFESGEHAILDRGLGVVVVKHQRDGFVLVYLERGSPTALTKVHHTRLRKAS
jgi:hypothetical protein